MKGSIIKRIKLKLWEWIFRISFIRKHKEKIIANRIAKRVRGIELDLRRALFLLKSIDNKRKDIGWNRQRRRQFWRDFYKSEAFRKEVFDEMLKEEGMTE